MRFKLQAGLRLTAIAVSLSSSGDVGITSGGGGDDQVPSAPTFLVVTPGNDQLSVSWDAVTTLVGGGAISGDQVATYTIRWDTTRANVEEGGTPAGSANVSYPTVSYLIASLAHATTYYVTVSATNSSGESDRSISYSGLTT